MVAGRAFGHDMRLLMARCFCPDVISVILGYLSKDIAEGSHELTTAQLPPTSVPAHGKQTDSNMADSDHAVPSCAEEEDGSLPRARARRSAGSPESAIHE